MVSLTIKVLILAWPVPCTGGQSCMPLFGNMATGPSFLFGFPFSLCTISSLCHLASEAWFGALQVSFSWEAPRDAVDAQRELLPHPTWGVQDHIWWRKLLANPKLPLYRKVATSMAMSQICSLAGARCPPVLALPQHLNLLPQTPEAQGQWSGMQEIDEALKKRVFLKSNLPCHTA